MKPLVQAHSALDNSQRCRVILGLLNWSFPGQVAQLVERSPEKAGVGGSIPSLATNCIRHFSESGMVTFPVTLYAVRPSRTTGVRTSLPMCLPSASLARVTLSSPLASDSL